MNRGLLKNTDENFIKKCSQSKKILVYTGFSYDDWNETYSKEKYLGGSERAVINIANCLSDRTDYEIYIVGAVIEETRGNVKYVGLANAEELIKTNYFHTIIISRYLGFFEIYPYFKTNNVIIWGHDTYLFSYGTNLTTEEIVKIWDHKINKCICLTEWHKDEYIKKYPTLKNKIEIIHNGINLSLFPTEPVKTKNRFIYSSSPERGLHRVLELWEDITDKFPGAELKIAGKVSEDPNIISLLKYKNIEHLGPLNPEQLYSLMGSSEYWLYPTGWSETYCITALEMMYSNVICIYYPLAGLKDTIGDHGIQISNGNEVQSILDLTDEKKTELIKNGRTYAEGKTWKNASIIWDTIIKSGYEF